LYDQGHQVALDSFFKLDQILYVFQFTIAKEQIAQRNPLSILPRTNHWHFVFIIPSPPWAQRRYQGQSCRGEVLSGSEAVLDTHDFRTKKTYFSAR